MMSLLAYIFCPPTMGLPADGLPANDGAATQIANTIAGIMCLFIFVFSSCLPCTSAMDTRGVASWMRHGLGLTIMAHAAGTFEVKVTPQKPDNKEAESANLGRMSIDKQFHGDLEGTSKGEMLSAMSDVKGSAGYVAMERVTGALHGRSGAFVLQHNGTMTRGEPQLSVTVVPDSGTGELAGLSGKLTIRIDGKQHFYEFDYAIHSPEK